ncbi:N-formylglutamate deformylase [Thalassotalea euphylliae]|uniref:N-formylglutamate deformylase n=1 Tax=Thalassotalea euphylliae TaxID=1655234 RepID=A0A3E0TVU0_9GAMM|nr:N-formylglutamate deformylase [Thalassotalea euphylliae]REL28589.1 N-formylglutamate deformylase [Thalassotalea euphylliae]
MTNSYSLVQGSTPLLISMPHNGQALPDDIAANMTKAGLAVRDTDWFLDVLYDFASELGASIIAPKYNRYVIDLNRDPNGVNLYPGANSTELCPTTAFDLSPIYLEGKAPDEAEVKNRVVNYWQPYHQALAGELAAIKQKFGAAVLLEAHSILSHVPRFFEGRLPDFNFGSADGQSCSPALTKRVEALEFAPYSKVTNGRFKGGYITRAYGEPEQNIHALQLELSQITYMDEASLSYCEQRAAAVKPKLKALVETLIGFGAELSAHQPQ